jgi:hypothetical protein
MHGTLPRSNEENSAVRQLERVTSADRVMDNAVRNFQLGSAPVTTHLIGVNSTSAVLRRNYLSGPAWQMLA